MNEIKQQLIQLFESRDVRRRRKLYEYYEDYFKQQHSLRFTLALINAALGITLITRLDIKYIRAHCQQWKKAPAEQPKIPVAPPENKNLKELNWTNQDELKNPSYSGSKLK